MPEQIKQDQVEVAAVEATQNQGAPEVTKILDPRELERQIIAQKVAEENKVATEDRDARTFMTTWNLYKKIIANLSSRQLRRLLLALVETPLNDKPYHITDKDEKMIFGLAMQALNAKWNMMLHTLAEHYKANPHLLQGELEKEIEDKKTEEIPQTQEQTTNG